MAAAMQRNVPMLRDEFLSVVQANDRDQLLKTIVDFTHQLGFETVSAAVVVDHFGDAPDTAWIDNTPAAYRESFEDLGNRRRDPVLRHCKQSSAPILWNQDTYAAVGLGEKWEFQAGFGYGTGVALALHLPAGRHFVMGVDRDQALPGDRNEVTRLVAELQLFAACAQEPVFRLLASELPEPEVSALTLRELESLHWTMEGKTAWEPGNILGISEQTAARHVNNATQKLGCVNKVQAVVRALRRGLIQ